MSVPHVESFVLHGLVKPQDQHGVRIPADIPPTHRVTRVGELLVRRPRRHLARPHQVCHLAVPGKFGVDFGKSVPRVVPLNVPSS